MLNQTYKELEIIAIDDASTDKSLELINQFKDSRLKVFSDKKLGRVNALNKGLAEATGQYVAILDADDEALANRITEQVHFMNQNTGIALVYSNVIFMNKEGRVFDQSHLDTRIAKTNQRLLSLNPFAHSSVLFRKSEVLDIGGYNSRCERSIDYNMYLELLINKKIIQGLSNPLTKLRVYDDSWGKVEGSSLQFFYGSLGLFNYFHALSDGSNYMRASDKEFLFFLNRFKVWYSKRNVLPLIKAKTYAHKAVTDLKKFNVIGFLKNIIYCFRYKPDFWNIRINPAIQLGDFNKFHNTLYDRNEK